jgi:hypothetical protein
VAEKLDHCVKGEGQLLPDQVPRPQLLHVHRLCRQPGLPDGRLLRPEQLPVSSQGLPGRSWRQGSPPGNG